MQKLELEDVHKHLLGIAKEFDRVCTLCNIPYYMAYGTMLGAIRHKGFIPWDDDMDFVVPIEHYRRLIDCLEKNLSYPYRCRTYKNSKAVIHVFIKIEDQTTISDSSAMDLPLEDKLGINIDVFPLNRYNCIDRKIKIVNIKTYLLGAAFSVSRRHNTSINKWIKALLRVILGGKPLYLQRSIEKASYSLTKGDKLGSICDTPGVEPIPNSWYGKGKRYEFENTTLIGPEMYDEYLTHMYGDYMTPPPPEECVTHAENNYLRD